MLTSSIALPGARTAQDARRNRPSSCVVAPESAASTERALAGEPIRLSAADGCAIHALHYPAAGPVRANLLLAPATGVPQGFYRKFARFAAARGYSCLTIDYRGVGLSAPPSLRGYRASFLDWARLDLAAAVDWLRDDRYSLYLVGHSFGGHALGLLPNRHHIDAAYTFATGAGWAGWMPRRERLRVTLLWNLVAPVLNRAVGYMACKRLGLGEDLPLTIYHEWKRWCRNPRYLLDDPTLGDALEGFNTLAIPMVAATATDDLWTTPRSRDAFWSGYRQQTWTPVDIQPAACGMREIGHMGYFRPQARRLWKSVLDWFEELNPVAPGAAQNAPRAPIQG